MNLTCEQNNAEHEIILQNILSLIDPMKATNDQQYRDYEDIECMEGPCWASYGNNLVHRFKRWNGHGESYDSASDCHNLVHIAADALYLWSLEQAGRGVDNRPGTKAFHILDRMKI